MFTWICPQCGREVPPAYSECPDCAGRQQPSPDSEASAQDEAPKVAEPEPPEPVAPAAAEAPPQTVQAPPPGAGVQYVHVKRRQPAWLVTLLVAAILIAAGGVAYYYLPSVRAQRDSQPPATSFEPPSTAGRAGAAPAAAKLGKFIEITGIRIIEENKRAIIRFLVVNHANAELAGIDGTIVLRASNAAPNSEPVSTIPFKLSSIDANESKEFQMPLKTNLRAYEMPDWQFLRAELELTSP